MHTEISVFLSGPAFSFLLFETSKCEFGQEGFLLGSICEQERQSITDNDQDQIIISRIIRVNGVIPCPVLGHFYNGIGKIDEDKIKSFLGSQVCKVVAWYRFNTIPIFKLTLRERNITKELANFFKIPQNLFSICILNKTVDNTNAYIFEQSFMALKSFRYEPLELHVTNLQDKKNCYRRYEYTSPTFQSLMNNLNIGPKTSQGVVYITELQKSVQQHLQLLVKELSEEEEKLFKLEEEVKQLLANRREKYSQITLSETELSDEEMDDDSSKSPCEICPFASRMKASESCMAQKMDI